MDVREKLVLYVCNATQKTNYKCDFNCEKKGKCAYCLVMAEQMIANGVTVQEWISVKDRLPKMREDGFADAFLVTNGNLAHIAYFVDGEWIFTDNGQMKEPMFYDVTHWLCLPQPPKGE